MFSYYGSKSLIVGKYPRPICDKIIEPFAGSARYALKYYDRDVLLVDKYEVAIRIWKWLQQCSTGDILGLPILKKGMDIRTLNVSTAEKEFLGMIAGVASISPRWTVSAYSSEQNGRKNYYRNLSKQLYKIKHWKIECRSYETIPDQKATWFIDPPYQVGGHAYVENKIDYPALREWIESREGQIIVCENTKADWMPFKPMVRNVGAMSTTTEAIWSNLKTNYDNDQLSAF